MSTKIPSFKCVLLGDGASGKTSFVRTYLTGKFSPRYEPTRGVEIHSLTFRCSNDEQLHFQVWDTAGQEEHGGLRDGYYLEAHCAILMFDLTSSNSLANVPLWYRQLVRVCSHIPIVLCGNKSDMVPIRMLDSSMIQRKLALKCYLVSAKWGYNFQMPFLWLARRLMNDRALKFCGNPSLRVEKQQPVGEQQPNGEQQANEEQQAKVEQQAKQQEKVEQPAKEEPQAEVDQLVKEEQQPNEEEQAKVDQLVKVEQPAKEEQQAKQQEKEEQPPGDKQQPEEEMQPIEVVITPREE